MENTLWRLICLSSNERIESNYSWKRDLGFNKREPIFDKRALGQSRRTSRCWFKLTKTKFFKNGIFNKASGPWTLYLSKMDPGFIQSIFKRSLFPCSPTGCFWVVSWNELSVKKRCLDVTFTTITQCKNLT